MVFKKFVLENLPSKKVENRPKKPLKTVMESTFSSSDSLDLPMF